MLLPSLFFFFREWMARKCDPVTSSSFPLLLRRRRDWFKNSETDAEALFFLPFFRWAGKRLDSVLCLAPLPPSFFPRGHARARMLRGVFSFLSRLRDSPPLFLGLPRRQNLLFPFLKPGNESDDSSSLVTAERSSRLDPFPSFFPLYVPVRFIRLSGFPREKHIPFPFLPAHLHRHGS